MTHENKQLLLKDLCSRLPYGVICQLSNKDADVSITEKLELGGLEHFITGNMCVKPYLRPLSSMTEEEKKDYILLSNHCIVTSIGFVCIEAQILIDWLNEHYFDHRGLIEKGLALEAKEGMYKID